MKKSKLLRKKLSENRPLLVIGAYSGLGARLAEEAGFDAVWASGLEISTSAGVPDANILTMTQFLRAGVEMDHATRLPIVADCDTGFGNSNNVIHMVRQYEAAGIAAVCMEDKKFPKVNSFVPGRQELAPIAEFVGKIMAAKHAQEDEDFMVIARVEALIAGWGQEEAMKRALAYVEAGADAILMHSKQPEPDEVLTFLKKWNKRAPIVLVPTTYPSITVDQMADNGVAMAIFANHGIRSQIRTVTEVFHEIAEAQGTASVQDKLVPLRRVFELQGMVQMTEAQNQYLRTGQPRPRAVIPASGDLITDESLAQVSDGDHPRALLDIFGKPILQRQVETLGRLGINDITFVSEADIRALLLDNVKCVKPPGGSQLATICAGLATLEPGDPVLVCYSDLLFTPDPIKRLLDVDTPFGLLVDRSFAHDERYLKKKLDFVVCDAEPTSGARDLLSGQMRAVRTIGKGIAKDEAHFEFVGLLSLNAAGHRAFLARFDAYKDRFASQPMGGAACFAEASLTDFLQQLVIDGEEVVAVEHSKGWMEVHDFADYRMATAQIKKGAL